MKTIKISIFVVLAVLAVSCSKSSQPLTELIVYDVAINNHDKVYDACNEDIIPLWFVNNLDASERFYFLNALFGGIQSGRIKVLDDQSVNGKYDYLLGETLMAELQQENSTLCISADKLKEKLAVNDSINTNCPSIRPFNALKSATLGARDVVSIRFCEKWTYDSTNMEIKKEIVAYAPLFYLSDPQRPWRRAKEPRPVFWVIQAPCAKANALITDKIMYSIPFEGGNCVYNEKPEPLKAYLNSLNSWVLADSTLKVRVWNYWARPDSIVPYHDLKALPFADPAAVKSVRVCPKHDRMVDCTEMDGLFFVEEWSLDPASMSMGKTISQVGVIAKFYKPDGATKEYFPLCFFKYGEASKSEKE